MEKDCEMLIKTKENKPVETKPKAQISFYDEMIDLLKEKLDDPDNYGTVADTRNACLYQDRFKLEKKQLDKS